MQSMCCFPNVVVASRKFFVQKVPLNLGNCAVDNKSFEIIYIYKTTGYYKVITKDRGGASSK